MPLPYVYRYGWSAGRTAELCVDQLRQLLKTHTALGETGAMELEPVLDEDHVHSARRFPVITVGNLRRTRYLADRTEIRRFLGG